MMQGKPLEGLRVIKVVRVQAENTRGRHRSRKLLLAVGRDAGTVEASSWAGWSATVQEENARNSARSARKSAKMSMNLCSAVRSHMAQKEITL